MRDIPFHTLFGLRIHAVTLAQAVTVCIEAIQRRDTLMIGVVNAAKLVAQRSDPLLRASLVDSDLVIADGMVVVWAAALLGRPLPERVTGIDLFMQLINVAQERSLGVYFLGATQEVLDIVLARVRREYPNLRIAGARNGYFSDSESELIADEIRRSHADMLFVAMTPPKKELFLGRFARTMAVPVCHGVGGSFDVFAGRTRRAPRLLQRFGLEWLYRVYQEPRRLWRRYLISNLQFVTMVLDELRFARLRRRTSSHLDRLP